jgi:hypothetical protein
MRYVFTLLFLLTSSVFAQITVNSTGDEPRRILQYAPVVGAEYKANMVISMNIAMKMAGEDFPEQSFSTTVPTITLPMLVRVAEVSSTGVVTASFEYGEVTVANDETVDPGLIEQLRTIYQGMKGAGGEVVTDSSGNLIRYSMNIPENMSPELQQYFKQTEDMVKQMVYSFPKEPLGVNASWQTVQPITNQGITLTQTTTTTIKEMSNETVALSIDIQQSTESQTLNLPNVPVGTSAQLERLNSQGSGLVRLSLGNVFPISSAMTMDMEMVTIIESEGHVLRQTMNMKMDMLLEGY